VEIAPQAQSQNEEDARVELFDIWQKIAKDDESSFDVKRLLLSLEFQITVGGNFILPKIVKYHKLSKQFIHWEYNYNKLSHKQYYYQGY